MNDEYYYYYPDFDPLKYKKPDEVQYTENNFFIQYLFTMKIIYLQFLKLIPCTMKKAQWWIACLSKMNPDLCLI